MSNNTVLFKTNEDKAEFFAIYGDIALCEVDAIVNAANNYLQHGGGVALAISRAGGEVIQQESNKISYVKTGDAVYTSAGKLSAKYVIHTVGPKWGEGNEEQKLRSAVRNSLLLANTLGANSIAFPAISTGIYGYPKNEGVQVIVDEVLKIQKHTNIVKVYFVANDKYTAELFKDTIRSLVI